MPETNSCNSTVQTPPCDAPLRRVALIVNPTAGRGRGERIAAEARSALMSQGVDVEILTTKGPGDATRMAREIAPRVDAVFGLGGDGTINEIGIGMLDHPEISLGIIPIGTANVLAHELGYPIRDPLAAINDTMNAKSRTIDVAMVGESLALSVCGAGLESIVVRDVAHARSGGGQGGMMRFVWPAAREFFTYWFHAPRFTITVDGKLLPNRCTSFVISNTRIYGGFMSVTPTANLLDGKLQVCSRRRPGVIANIMALIAALMWVKQPAILAKYAEGQVIEITTNRTIPLQIDGDNAPFELSPDKALTIRILPQRLRVLLPRDAPFTSMEKQE